MAAMLLQDQSHWHTLTQAGARIFHFAAGHTQHIRRADFLTHGLLTRPQRQQKAYLALSPSALLITLDARRNVKHILFSARGRPRFFIAPPLGKKVAHFGPTESFPWSVTGWVNASSEIRSSTCTFYSHRGQTTSSTCILSTWLSLCQLEWNMSFSWFFFFRSSLQENIWAW